jgi:hypothetical protein
MGIGATEADLPTTPAPITAEPAPIGPAASSRLIRLAVDYNDALDRCTQTSGANIDDVMDLFAEGATWTLVGVTSLTGKVAIREMFLHRTTRYQQSAEITGIELCGDLVICHAERRDTTFVNEGRERQIRILLVKSGKIEQVIVVFDLEAFARMRGGAAAAAQTLDLFRARDNRE